MNALYLLTEDDHDDLFFERCAERISGLTFHQVNPRRIRKEGGVSEVLNRLPNFLNDLKSAVGYDRAFFIIAIDNDRSPSHPGHQRISNLPKIDQSKGCRMCELDRDIIKRLGPDRSKWPAQGAVAVPVQMLESWLLLSLDPTATDESLPLFSKQAKRSARDYHNGNPPLQLKDRLEEQLVKSSHHRMGELILEVAGELDLDELARKSLSFRQFREQVDTWKQ